MGNIIYNKNNKKSSNKLLFYVMLITFLFIITSGIVILLNHFRNDTTKTFSPFHSSPSGWVEENGQKYYYHGGQKVKGWLEKDDTRYYFDTTTGKMVVGELRLSKKEHFLFSPEGKLYTNRTIDGYEINELGFIVNYRKKTQKPEIDTRLFHEQLSYNINNISQAYGADGVSVALIENGKVIDSFQYGYAVVPGGTVPAVPMTKDSKIRIASISKVISSMIGFRMNEEGLLDLNESIGTYWGFPTYNPSYPDNVISLASIYTHTSSIADLSSYGKIEANLKSNTLYNNTEPGNPSSSSYCNYAFAVGASTLERAGRKTLDQLADEYFFGPLGIDASFTSGNLKDFSLLAELRYDGGGLAHSLSSFRNITGSDTPGTNGRYAVGGLCISAVDLAKLICILANDGKYENAQYLKNDSINLMETPYASSDYHGVETVQCMPLRYSQNIYGESSLYFHSGSAYGVYSLFTYNPETKNGVVVITTGANGRTDENGIYAICGEINSLLYEHLRTKYKQFPYFINKQFTVTSADY